MNSLRSIWNQMPAVRLLMPYLAGIFLYIETPASQQFTIWIAGGLLLAAVCVLIYINRIRSVAGVYKWRYAGGAAVSVAVLSLAYMVTFFDTDSNDWHHIAHLDASYAKRKAMYKGIVCDPPVIAEKTLSVLMQMEEVSTGDSVASIGGKVLASVAKDDSSQALHYGDEIVFSGVVTPYEDPKNPDQFNYRNYQALHHIFHRVYLRNGEWKRLSNGHGNGVLAAIYNVRSYFLSLVKETVHGADQLAVATAIMLGYRDYITDDITQAYAGSGVLHVLSVSGLHVAVLYYVLNILLGWMDRRRRLAIVKGGIVIIVMLFYACLTGLSPPVLRSVWMFILITIARLLDRDVSMYNVLGVSCLVLLIWDPYFAADVGYQLSYIAVAGIVYLYPMFHKLWQPPSFSFRKPFGAAGKALNYLFDFTWGLICVSLAAQLATFPISLYYFHTFPNFFLLSNLLVIPLSNFVLISGMVLFAVGWCHWLLIGAGWVFDHLLLILNKVVYLIDGLPFALTNGIVLNAFEMALLYVVIAMVCWFMADRRAKVLLAALLLLLILCTAFSVESIKKDNARKLLVYDVSGKKAIALIIQRRVYYDFDSSLINNKILMRYNVREHWWQGGVEKEIPSDSAGFVYALPFGKLYAVNEWSILVIDKAIESRAIPKLRVDIVILSGNARSTMEDISKCFDFKELVFDSSNKTYQVKLWKDECAKMKMRYHDCREAAFEKDL